MALLSSAPDAKWVFIEGGTLPRGRVDASVGYRTLASHIARVDSGPAPEWRVTDQHNCASTSTGLAVGRLMDDWAGGIGFSGSGDPVMVGLGVPETLALNDAARRHLVETGQVDGPAVSSRGRLFQAGDRVVAIRGAGAGLPCGTVGSVVEVDTKKRSAMITWPDRASEMRRDALATIGHAYAATPRLAARMDGPLLVLGRSEGMGLARSRIAAEVSVERAAPALGTGRRVDPIARGIC
jgi:hypothetical protein